jgi:hypothetical protein
MISPESRQGSFWNMHENSRLLEKFFKSIQRKDHRAVADCYHPEATFEDIAFELSGQKRIHAMWHMIAESDMRLSFTIENVGERDGSAFWIADYTFKDTDRKVHNEVKSNFIFGDGLIIKQTDTSDARKWGLQALGPVSGLLSWLLPAIRRRKAKQKLDSFVATHPQYQ